MSSLTIEMGLRRKRGNSPTMPDQLASRDDVTLAQKQRLAMLSKMGLGPVAGAGSSSRPAPVATQAIELSAGPPPMDRRAALLEKERRFREQQEREQELEEQAQRERQAKAKKTAGGIARLGPVMPREDEAPQFPPAPAQVPTPRGPWENGGAPVRPRPTGMLQVKIPQDMAERTKAPDPEPAEEESSDSDKDEGGVDLASQVLAQIAAQKRAMATKAEKKKQEEERRKKTSKKKRKRDRDDDAHDNRDEDAYDEDDDASEDGGYERLRRDTAASSKPMPMIAESVKGKVSLDNKNFTDADLERRFQQQESGRSAAGLMTEEQVLKMIQKEKKTQGPAGSASRRVQRELAEWAAAKEQQRQRVKSPHRFERMVVSRK